MRVVSFSEARSQFKRVIDQAVDDCDATLIHRRDGENAVLISEATYNSMVETLYLLSSPANAQRLMEAMAMDKEGKAEDHESCNQVSATGLGRLPVLAWTGPQDAETDQSAGNGGQSKPL